MKNFKIYKSVLAILTSASILLLSGCSGDSNKEEKKAETTNKTCKHLTIYFEDEPVTFKECDGYSIGTTRDLYYVDYQILKDNEKILEGETQIENLYYINHNLADEIIENESIQKVEK